MARKFSNYFIDPKYQIKIGLIMAAFAMTIGAINLTVFYYYAQENYELLISPLVDAKMIEENVLILLNAELTNLLKIIIISDVVFGLICLIIGFFVSHKVLGPLVAMERVFKSIGEGQSANRLKLRDSDAEFFKKVASAFNHMADKTISATKKNSN